MRRSTTPGFSGVADIVFHNAMSAAFKSTNMFESEFFGTHKQAQKTKT